MRKYNRIRVVLAEQDKTSTWLANQLGYNKSTVSRWCSNTVQPTVESLFKIAEVLDVDVRELLWSNKERKPQFVNDPAYVFVFSTLIKAARLAIYNTLRGRSETVEVRIVGYAMSMGSVIVVAGSSGQDPNLADCGE